MLSSADTSFEVLPIRSSAMLSGGTAGADALGGVYWDVDSSFSKFKMPGFKLGPFSF